MGLGLVLGGAAQGFQRGLKIAKDLEDQQRQREKVQREREADAIGDVMVDMKPGDFVDADTTPEVVAKKAIDGATPKPGPLSRMVKSAVKGLRVGEAAQAAGVTPPPELQPAAAGGLNTAETAAPGAAPAVEEVQVTKPRGRMWTEGDAARLMLARAVRTGDQQAIQSAWTNVVQTAQNDTIDEITRAGHRGMDGLTNYYIHMTGQDVDYEPNKADPSKYDIIVNGKPAGTFTQAELTDKLIGEVKRDPHYGLQARLQAREADRLERVADATLRNQNRTLDLRAQEARADAAYKAAQTNYMQTKSAQAQAEFEAAQAELQFSRGFRNMLYDGDGAGDAFLNADSIAAQAQAVPDAKKIKTKDAEGNEILVNPYDLDGRRAIAYYEKRFRDSPYTQMGPPNTPKERGAIIQRVTVDVPNKGPRNLYTVAGYPGRYYTNFDAAESAAYKKYPNVKAAK